MKIFFVIIAFVSVFLLLPVRAQSSFMTQTIAPKKLPRNAVRVPVLKVLVPASAQDRNVNAVTLRLTGLIDNNDIGRVWIETNRGQRSFSRSFGVDYRVNLPFRSTVIIPGNESMELYVLINLNASASRSFQIQVDTIELLPLQPTVNRPVYQPFQQQNYRQNAYFNTSRFPRARIRNKNFSLVCKDSKCQRVYK